MPPSGSRTRLPGDYVVLAVADSGHGMDAETAARIFEPFFTTKERGAGTGLGLATVYGIAKQFGGDIEVESEPGVGTTFRLYFPRVSATPEPFVSQPVDDGRPLQGAETVLLVEDEEALRSIGKEILEAYGYTVILAGDGLEALEVAQNGAEPIQLLMTDILMPRMGGIELAERSHRSALRPEDPLHLGVQRQRRGPAPGARARGTCRSRTRCRSSDARSANCSIPSPVRRPGPPVCSERWTASGRSTAIGGRSAAGRRGGGAEWRWPSSWCCSSQSPG